MFHQYHQENVCNPGAGGHEVCSLAGPSRCYVYDPCHEMELRRWERKAPVRAAEIREFYELRGMTLDQTYDPDRKVRYRQKPSAWWNGAPSGETSLDRLKERALELGRTLPFSQRPIERAIALRRDGMSQADIAKQLMLEGLFNRRTGRGYRQNTVSSWLAKHMPTDEHRRITVEVMGRRKGMAGLVRVLWRKQTMASVKTSDGRYSLEVYEVEGCPPEIAVWEHVDDDETTHTDVCGWSVDQLIGVLMETGRLSTAGSKSMASG